jgi:hypothetical protein
MLVRNFFQGPGYLTFCSLMKWEANPSELSGGSDGQGTEGQSVESQGSEGSGYSSFLQDLLKDAPQEHLSIMEPYIKKFDAGVTRRFQDLNSKFKHYEPLGWDEETTQQMAEVHRILTEEPETMLEYLREELEKDGEAQKDESILSESGQAIQGQLPPEFQAQWDQSQQILQALAQYVLDDHSAKTTAVEDEEFKSYMGLLKDEYGNFDEEYVMSMIANGRDGEEAVKQWKAKEQEILALANQATQNLPPTVLSSAGGGAVAQGEPQRLGSIPEKDIRQLITNVLTQTQQSGQ